MRIPPDSPQWVEKFLQDLENEAASMIDKASTADEALRAAGAFRLLKYASAELEFEASRQEEQIRSLNRNLNAR